MIRKIFIPFLCFLFSMKVLSQEIQKNDTIEKEIFKFKKGELDFFYKEYKQISQSLKLNSPDLGYDSLEIRIWLDYGLRIQKQLLIFKYNKFLWQGDYYLLIYKIDSKKDSSFVISFEEKIITPKTGWDNFIKKLMSLGILTLPHSLSIENYGVGADGNSIYVEVSTKKKYRIYGYFNVEPLNVKSRFWQENKMKEIIKIVLEEFDIKMLSEEGY